jgi:hypothetical protein
VELLKKAFNNDSINFDLNIIYFLQFLFNLPGVIGMLSNGQEIWYFQAFQLKSSTSPNKSNENIDDNNDIYGVSSNNINIKEKEELNDNETKQEKKEEEKEKPPQASKTIFETHTSNQQNESEKNAEQNIPKYNGFTYNEKDRFNILVKNNLFETGNFYITKKKYCFCCW